MPQIKSHLRNIERAKPKQRLKARLRLDMNEGIQGLPKSLVKKVVRRINSDLLSAYPEYEAVQEEIAAHSNLRPENICLSNGSDAAIKYIFDAYVSAGDKILLLEPTFAMYEVYCRMFNSEVIKVKYNSDFSFPGKDFMKQISSGLRAAVVVNPNNPTGTSLLKDELIAIIKKCADNDILLIVDEAYFYFYLESIIEQVNNYRNLIVLRTFSKFFSMAALRLGYAAGSPELIEGLRKVRPAYEVNALAVLFAREVLGSPYIIQKLTKSIDEGKKYLVQALFREGIEYRESRANFILIRCGGRTSEIIERLAAVGILVGGGFKEGFLREYIRVTLGNKIIMSQFFKSFIRAWRKKGI